MKKLATLALAGVLALSLGLTASSAFAGGAVDYDEASCAHFLRTAYIAEHPDYVGLRIWKDSFDTGTPIIESETDLSAQGVPAVYGTFNGDYYTVSANFPELPNGTVYHVEIYSADAPEYGAKSGYFSTTMMVTCNSAFNPTPTPTPSATPEPTAQPVSSATGSTPYHEPSKPAAPHCYNEMPTSVSQLFQVDARKNDATLYFTPGGDNTHYYHIAYGYSATDERFGTQFDASQKDGVQAYTINHLAPGTTYYFKVRPANGCAGREWSNVLKITTPKNGAKKSFYLFNGKKS